MLVGYFPQEWLGFLIVGAILSVAIGCALAFRLPLTSSKHIAGAIAISLCFGLLSVAFDYYYLHALHTLASGEYSTLAKPITGCQALTNYLSDKASGDPMTYEGWKQAISDGRCGVGSAVTMIISCLLAWCTVTASSYSVMTLIKFALAFATENPQKDVVIADHVSEIEDANEHENLEEETENTVSIEANQPTVLPDQHRVDQKTSKLLKDTYKLLVVYGKGEVKKCPIGEMLRDFLWKELDLKKNKAFNYDLKISKEPYIGLTYSSFMAIKDRGTSQDAIFHLFEWASYCKQRSLEGLILEFNDFYKEKRNKAIYSPPPTPPWLLIERIHQSH